MIHAASITVYQTAGFVPVAGFPNAPQRPVIVSVLCCAQSRHTLIHTANSLGRIKVADCRNIGPHVPTESTSMLVPMVEQVRSGIVEMLLGRNRLGKMHRVRVSAAHLGPKRHRSRICISQFVKLGASFLNCWTGHSKPVYQTD